MARVQYLEAGLDIPAALILFDLVSPMYHKQWSTHKVVDLRGSALRFRFPPLPAYTQKV